jgi:hypothetical protein
MGFEDVAQGILVFCAGVASKQAPQRLRMFPYGPTRPGRRAAVTAGLSGRCYRFRGGVEGGP